MLTSQRKKLILEKLGAEGQVQSKALSMLFDVSEDTIRRDLRELAAEGRLQRVHGGAAVIFCYCSLCRTAIREDGCKKEGRPERGTADFIRAGGDR